MKIRLLTLVVRSTMLLLSIGAMLVVVGMFDSYLDWDIFGPKIEAVLTAVFASSVALAAFGVAMTIVLGTQDIVVSFRNIQEQKSGGKAGSEATAFQYYKVMVLILAALSVIIVSLAGANWGIRGHRSSVFKKVVNEQMAKFGPKIADKAGMISVPDDTAGIDELDALLKTLKQLSFISCVELYLPDKDEELMLWSYTPDWSDETAEFQHTFAAREKETAIYEAMRGDTSGLDAYNKNKQFSWLHLIRDKSGAPAGVVEICANERENFREYSLGK